MSSAAYTPAIIPIFNGIQIFSSDPRNQLADIVNAFISKAGVYFGRLFDHAAVPICGSEDAIIIWAIYSVCQPNVDL